MGRDKVSQLKQLESYGVVSEFNRITTLLMYSVDKTITTPYRC